jgi:uncharacterized protein (TIGR02265 family)
MTTTTTLIKRARLTPSTPITSQPNTLERRKRMPADFMIKGMFFARTLEVLGTDAKHYARELLSPPRLGRYLPFSDYPQRDFSCYATAAAVKRFPMVPSGEAHRLFARRDVEVFATSTLGSVTMSLMRDPKEALLKLPAMYGMVLRGGTCTAASVGPRAAQLSFKDFHAGVDTYAIGHVEGLVLHYGGSPVIELDLQTEIEGTYLVSW